MTKKELEQYIKLKKEIDTIGKRLEKLYEKEPPEVAGKVQASSDGFPWLRYRVTVQMYEPKANAELNKTIDILRERLERCDKQMKDVEEFIDNIPDSELRNIFELRYIEGLKLREIADRVNLDLSVVGKKITAYLRQ